MFNRRNCHGIYSAVVTGLDNVAVGGDCTVDEFTVTNPGYGGATTSRAAADLADAASWHSEQREILRFAQDDKLLGTDSGASVIPSLPRNLAKRQVAAAEDYWLWVTSFVYTAGGASDGAMTSAHAQEWLDEQVAMSSHVVIEAPATNAPLPDDQLPTAAIAMHDAYSPTLRLMQDNSGYGVDILLYETPLVYSYTLTADVFGCLPDLEDEAVVRTALAFPPEGPTEMPEGINLADGEWYWSLRFYLDYGGEFGAGAGYTVNQYHCFTGSADPYGQSAGAPFDCPTCVGPIPSRLGSPWESGPPLDVSGARLGWVEAGDSIALRHDIRNYAEVEADVIVQVAATGGIDVQLVEGSSSGPHEPYQALSQPVHLGEGSHYTSSKAFWVVAEVPEDTVRGPQSIVITGTHVITPAVQASTADALWVQSEVDPPEPVRTYLPLLLR